MYPFNRSLRARPAGAEHTHFGAAPLPSVSRTFHLPKPRLWKTSSSAWFPTAALPPCPPATREPRAVAAVGPHLAGGAPPAPGPRTLDTTRGDRRPRPALSPGAGRHTPASGSPGPMFPGLPSIDGLGPAAGLILWPSAPPFNQPVSQEPSYLNSEGPKQQEEKPRRAEVTIFLFQNPTSLFYFIFKEAAFCLPPQASLSSQQGLNSQTFF